ncbi:MAG: AGE family epimerase/isomerase [Anaerolineae bacterium]
MDAQRDRPSRLHEQVTQHLQQGLIPYWFARAWDAEYGGYLTNFDEQGDRLDTPEKYLNTQCRLLWWFSTLYRRHPDLKQAGDLAAKGFEFMLAHFWDAERGGWYWKVQRDGSRLDDGKVVYGESFAIYALSEYTLATGDGRGLAYAAQTFDLLQKYAADTQRAGYLENLEQDWSPAPPGFAAGDRKSLDTHMHLLESFTTLYAASGEEIHRRKLLEVANLIVTRMVDPVTGCGRNQFDLDWQPIPAIAIRRTWNAEREGDAPATPTDTTSYGHNVELAWLLNRALQTAGADPTPYYPVMRRLLDHAVAHGVDWEMGGIYRDGVASGEALIKEKEFWQHAESLVGFLDGYATFGEPVYLDAFECIWRFVSAHMIAQDVGEWRTLLDRDGRAIDGRLGNPWKVAYHTGRSMLECASRLDNLLGRT